MTNEVDRRLQLIDRVFEKTHKGEVNWEATVMENEFQISFPNYSIRITKEERQRTHIFDMEPQAVEVYILKIYDSSGTSIEEIDVSGFNLDGVKRQEYRQKLEKIYRQARIQAYNVEKAIDDLLQNLSQEGE